MTCRLTALLVSLLFVPAASGQEDTAELTGLKEQIISSLREMTVDKQNRLIEAYVELRNLTRTDEFSGELTFNPDNSALVNVVIVSNEVFDDNDPNSLTSALEDAL